MTNFKEVEASPWIETRELNDINEKTGNLYESVTVISKRANQINVKMTKEIREKLEEFGSTTDSLEEVHENTEQIEISKFYEKLPNPTLIATNEFLEDKLFFRKPDNEDDDLLD